MASHQFSRPHTPEQNGITEHKNCHILETARTLLHHASLPPQFWIMATNTAAYQINRHPTKTLHMQSPYQKLYQQPPSLLHLKNFGCLCYPWTAYTRTNKFDPKFSPCIFLGYLSDHKGFRYFDPLTSKLIISRYVRFHKHEFPMAKPNPTTPPPQISNIHNPLSPLLIPSFHPPPHTSPSPLIQPPTSHPPPPPPRKTDTYIQYYRRRPPPTTLSISTPPPLLPSPKPSPTPPQDTRPPYTHPMTTCSKTNTPTTSLYLSLTTSDPQT